VSRNRTDAPTSRDAGRHRSFSVAREKRVVEMQSFTVPVPNTAFPKPNMRPQPKPDRATLQPVTLKRIMRYSWHGTFLVRGPTAAANTRNRSWAACACYEPHGLLNISSRNHTGGVLVIGGSRVAAW